MTYRIFPAVAFVALAVALVLLSAQQRPNVAGATVQVMPGDPGYAARNAHLTETGRDGLPLYQLDAALIRQLPSQERVQLEDVRLGFRDPAGQAWTAQARHGLLGQSTGAVSLSGAVVVRGVLLDSPDEAEIATEQLWVDTQTQVVSTTEPVTLKWNGHELKALGLVASLRDRHVRLQSAVHGNFTP